ncbi:MAG: acetyl-CoA acetyltransferase [Thermodesulfobacteriota bacterium]|nr:acetyl-CoA acetyltransferase [Thermodesulfobacteriota bacterium]
MGSIKDKVAIVGMGCSKFGERWGLGAGDLAVESAYEAYEDAGVGPDDIEACWVGQMYAPVNGIAGSTIADTLKLTNIPIIRNENWCTAGHIALIEAALAVASGVYDVVMAIGVEKLKDTGYPGLGTGRGMNPVYEARRTAPGSFGLIATSYFNKYGLSMEEGKETIGKIAVKNHRNGSMCPKAHFRNKITLDKVVNAPIIAYPLGLFDCCGNSDGSACAILAKADIAKRFCDDPIYIKGFGISMDAGLPHTRPEFGWTSFEALKNSSRQAYEMAGIKNPREEIDLAEVHDCFSITELAIYEDFGFSLRGRAKEDIDSGFFELEGGLPVNSDGGLKCFGHPVGASGLRMTYEVYKQLQHKADLPERQIKNANRGLSHTFGGPPQLSAVAIFGNEKG